MGAARTPEERFLEIIDGLKQRIAALEARPLQIPIVDADLSSDYKGNVWMFSDGRLHLRLNDGSIVEFTSGTSGGGSSGTPAPPVPPQPITYETVWSATWTQAYRAAGGFTGGDNEKLYYGNSGASSYNGRQSSLIGFDYAAIATALSGATVNSVSVYLYNEHTWASSGATVFFGTHTNATKPGTFGGVVSNFVSSGSTKRSTGAWHAVNTAIGAQLRDGLAKGVVLQAPNDSTAYYGYASGIGAGPPIPQIRINYTK
jgi:hypothetical protein